MFKANEFKKLIGFNHTKLVIISVILTGISFPFLFLGDEVKQIEHNGIGHAIFGWVYAAILHYVNLFIFYWLKKLDARKQKINALNLFFTRNYPIHVITTVTITILMSLDPMNATGIPCTNITILRNVLGTVIFMSVLVGFYEAAYYMNALNISIKETESLKRENVESQLEVLKNRVQPHFLFNSLNTLASIIPDEPEHAVKYVQSLSKVYRYILEIKDKKLIPVYKEMKCVQAYLFMLETRFGDNLRCNIQLTGVDDNHFIVPLSIQMLIENAVKHNVISSRRPLTIDISSENGMLKVQNNLQLKDQEVASTGTGLQNISSRYEITAGTSVLISENSEYFSVSIPLIEVAES